MTKIKIIKPTKGLVGINIKELIEFRELLYFLAWRNIKIKYKQTVIGGLWAIVQPLSTMIIFTVFFGTIAHVPSDGIPYAIFSYSGLLLWTYFSGALTSASESLISDERLVTKAYCPKILIPTSAAITGLLDYMIAALVLIMLMIYYHFSPPPSIFLIPIIVFFSLMLATGLGYFFAALNVKYRDIRYAIPFCIQLLIFITPVIYPVSIVPENYRWILFLNPMSGFIEAHRAAFLGHQPIPWFGLEISIVATILIFIFCTAYFKATERFFADLI